MIKMKYLIFFMCLFLLIGISSAATLDTTDSPTQEITKTPVQTQDTPNYQKTVDTLENTNNHVTKQITKTNTTNNTKTATSTKTNKIYVNPNATKTQTGSSKYPYATIQKAISKTLKGYDNRIYLSAGNHILNTSVTITNTVTITGKDKETTKIICKKNQAFRVRESNLTIQKLSVQNAYYSQGGAILVTANSKITINNCTFKNNEANNGGVIFTSGNNVIGKISNTKFENNKAIRFGAALQLGGYNSVYTINNCIFKNNVLTDTDYSHSTGGAAIYASSFATVNINKCKFKNNVALWGNAILNGNHAKIKITNSNFTNNVAKHNVNGNNRTKGGAVAIGSGYAEIGKCIFASNKADIGGAITINSGEKSYIYSCTFQQNQAYYHGGAINNYGSLILKNNKFIKNTATYNGGAIQDKGINEVNIEGCIFKDNRVNTSRIESKTALLPQGGAISIIGAPPHFIIKNTLFDHNSAYYAGAIFSSKDTKWITLINTTFKNNTACYGAAIIISGETTLALENSSFKYNRALKKGGAIIINGSSQANFYNTKFIKNQATINDDGDGGAIYIMSYSRLSFSNCNFENNYAKYNGGAICAVSVVNIHITGSNMTNNQAKTGSAIYIDNSKNYKSMKSQIILDTSAFISNKGNYTFYSKKAFNSTYNYNIVRTCWWGTNVVSNSFVKNFKILNYHILSLNLNSELINYTWTKSNVFITINRTQNSQKDLIVTTFTIKEGNTLRYTDAFLPTRKLKITQNDKKTLVKDLYVYYHLNLSLKKIVLQLDNQKITIKIVK